MHILLVLLLAPLQEGLWRLVLYLGIAGESVAEMVAAWPQVMLFVVFASYAMLGPVERLFWLAARGFGKKGAGKMDSPPVESKL